MKEVLIGEVSLGHQGTTLRSQRGSWKLLKSYTISHVYAPQKVHNYHLHEHQIIFSKITSILFLSNILQLFPLLLYNHMVFIPLICTDLLMLTYSRFLRYFKKLINILVYLKERMCACMRGHWGERDS